MLELSARSVLEFWCGLVQQLLGGKVPVFKRSGDMHELPLRLDIAFDRRCHSFCPGNSMSFRVYIRCIVRFWNLRAWWTLFTVAFGQWIRRQDD